MTLRQSTRGSTTSIRFGTSDVRDLSDGQLPVVVARVNVDRRTGVSEDVDTFNVRTEKQVWRRVRECQAGYTCGVDSHVEIRSGPR